MRRPFVLASGVLLALSAAFAQSLAAPLPAMACSCVAPLPSIERVAADPNVVVIAGTIGQQLPDRTPVAVDTWFHGSGPSDVVWLSFGSQSMSSCDPFVSPGERWLMVLHRQDEGIFSYSPCVVSGAIGTDSGDEALAQATEIFAGQMTPPPGPTEPPISPRPPTTDPAGGWVYIVGALGAAALVFAVVALVGLRRRQAR